MSDVCTIVSILPQTLRESKPQVPANHIIPAGSYDNPTLYLVRQGTNNIYIAFDRPQIPTPVLATEIANSIVSDYKRACLAFRDEDCCPGLFWLSGQLTLLDILALKEAPEESDKELKNFVKVSDEPLRYINPLKRAKKAQETWFSALVQLADDDYAKSARPGSISDLQRMAAKSLGLNREWFANVVIKATTCQFCGSSIRENVPVCAVCHRVVNQELLDKLERKLDKAV